MQFLIKVVVSALIIAAVAELGKRISAIAALLASLPMNSVLAMIWLYRDTGNVQKIAELSTGIFWAVLPSLLFLILLPQLLKSGVKFWSALVLSSIAMFAAYSVYLLLLNKFGIKI